LKKTYLILKKAGSRNIDQYMKNTKIKTWKQFAKIVRPKGCYLLKNLNRFQNSIIVTGCQRSGTTILSRIITLSDEMVNYWFGKDDELDAALILSGEVDHKPQGRYCFQTTYLNECYKEYFEHKVDFKIIWVLRNPYSVVYSLLHNWKRWPLNELFESCGCHLLKNNMAIRYKRYGLIGVPRLIKACLSYNGKVSQLFEINQKLKEKLLVVEYDDLVNNANYQLPKIYDFLNISYRTRYAERLHKKSTGKKLLLSKKEMEKIGLICMPVYEKAKLLVF
jgi:hypothetical protein